MPERERLFLLPKWRGIRAIFLCGVRYWRTPYFFHLKQAVAADL